MRSKFKNSTTNIKKMEKTGRKSFYNFEVHSGKVLISRGNIHYTGLTKCNVYIVKYCVPLHLVKIYNWMNANWEKNRETKTLSFWLCILIQKFSDSDFGSSMFSSTSNNHKLKSIMKHVSIKRGVLITCR